MSGATHESLEIAVNEAVRAGAGAGKTRALSQRVVLLAETHLGLHQRLPRIVVTTFTKKATEELRERITAEIYRQKKFHLLELVDSKQYLHISTIHGVLSTFLRRFGHLLGMEAGFRVVDDEVLRRAAKVEIKKLIDSGDVDVAIWDRLSLDQSVDVLLRFCAESLIHPELQVFSAEDHRQAFLQMVRPPLSELERVFAEIQQGTENDKWRDYAANALGLLRRHCGGAESDVQGFLAELKNLGRKPIFKKAAPPFAESLFDDQDKILKDLGKVAEKRHLDPLFFEFMSDVGAQVQTFAMAFRDRFFDFKMHSGQIGSEDLELIALKTLREEPSLGRLFAADWDYWLVDEYQDTSPVQVEILKALRGDRPLYVVGDPQQSIYLFRGARVEVFDHTLQSIADTGGKISELRVNYRSTPELLTCLNDLVRFLGPEFSPMDPQGPITNPKDVVLTARVGGPDDDGAYAAVATYIQRGVEQGERFGDYCILARTNDLLLEIARYLEAAGFPTAVHSATGFYGRREVLDALSLLKFLVNPHDNVNLIRLLRSPWFHVDDTLLAKALAKKGASHWVILSRELKDQPIMTRLRDALVRTGTDGVFEVFLRQLKASGMVDASHWHDPTGRRESNIWKLTAILRQEQRKPGFNFATFFRRVERAWNRVEDDADASPANEPNRVNLMTIHKSKGLKFKHVILPRMEKVPGKSSSKAHDAEFVFDEETMKWSPLLALGDEEVKGHGPAGLLALRRLDEREAAEHKRLFYVAVTRAQKSLMFHAIAKKSGGFGDGSWASYFPFLMEAAGQAPAGRAPAETVEREGYSVSLGAAEVEFTARRAHEQEAAVIRSPYMEATDQDGDGEQSWRRFSVSRLLEKKEVAEGAAKMISRDQIARDQIARDQVARVVKAPGVGSILHRIFESLKHERGADDLNGYLQRWLGDQAQEYQSGIDYVLQLGDPDLRAIIAAGEVEWGFQVKTKKGILEGQIDLWGPWKDSVWVVDYKSGSPEQLEKAYEQLRLYAYALHQMFGHQNFKLAVVYPRARKVEVRDFNDVNAVALTYSL